MKQRHSGDRAALAGLMPLIYLAFDDALKELETLSQRQSRVVELRYFGGLSVDETATVLEVSPETVMRDWTIAKTWLHHALKPAANV